MGLCSFEKLNFTTEITAVNLAIFDYFHNIKTSYFYFIIISVELG